MPAKSTFLIADSASDKKIAQLLTLEKITTKDFEDFTYPERRRFEQTATEILNDLTGPERDRFLDKIDQLLPAEMKHSVWEYNHAAINNAIAAHMRDYGVMPAKNHIAEETGLSRQTVAKHLKDYKLHPQFKAEMEQFQFMTHSILANVYKFASKGDMKAARLYFDMVGSTNKGTGSTVVNEQNNYIQINNTILSQENLKHFSAEQLAQIENIITNKEKVLVG